MNRPKIAGTRFERAVCDYLEPRFPHVERQCLRGNRDRGDLLGIVGWALELKAEKKLDPTTALKEAEVAARNSGAAWHAAILKRPRRGIGDALVVMTLDQWADLIADERRTP
jgi:hypothetical protein